MASAPATARGRGQPQEDEENKSLTSVSKVAGKTLKSPERLVTQTLQPFPLAPRLAEAPGGVLVPPSWSVQTRTFP